MQVTWDSSLPRWAGISCAIFGVANILGAAVSASGMTFPGIVIGGAWTIVGLKGGLPRFGAASAANPAQSVAEGLRTLCRGRLAAFVAPVAWMAGAAVILPSVPKELVGTCFFLTAFPLAAVLTVWGLSACPRCGQHFFRARRFRFRGSLSQCQNCGLSLRGE